MYLSKTCSNLRYTDSGRNLNCVPSISFLNCLLSCFPFPNLFSLLPLLEITFQYIVFLLKNLWKYSVLYKVNSKPFLNKTPCSLRTSPLPFLNPHPYLQSICSFWTLFYFLPSVCAFLHMWFPLSGISFPAPLAWLTLVHPSRLSTDIACSVDCALIPLRPQPSQFTGLP